jgi:hypothetical protein
MTTTEPNRIKITMSERRPLSIVEDDWPLIASADWYSGQFDVQANYKRTIRVREHRDGRRIVYGRYYAGPGGVPTGWRGAEGGFLVDSSSETRPGVGTGCAPDEAGTVRAIRRVAGIIGDDAMGDECIADLPSEEIERVQS